MAAARLDKAAGLRVTFSTRANPLSLVIDDEAAVPAKWLRETQLSAPDKLAIKAALAADPDLEIAGVHLEQGVSLVRK
jgi:hypothetical protein